MNKPKIYSLKISIDSLPNLIKEIINEGISLNYLIIEPIIIERHNETFFKRFNINEIKAYNLSESYLGRVFGENTEIRWRRNENEFIVLLISEIDKVSLDSEFINLEDTEDVSMYEARNNSYFLWGEHLQDNKWYEGRIPRILEYPIDKISKYVKLQVVEYKKDGLIQFIRFVKLEECDGLCKPL